MACAATEHGLKEKEDAVLIGLRIGPEACLVERGKGPSVGHSILPGRHQEALRLAGGMVGDLQAPQMPADKMEAQPMKEALEHRFHTTCGNPLRASKSKP